MTYRRMRRCLPALLIALMILSGCQGGEVDPRPGSGDLNIHVDRLEASDSAYRVEVRVEFEWYVDEQRHLEDVLICAYDRNGEVLSSANLGSFSTPSDGGAEIINASTRPYYIVVDHETLYENGFQEIRIWDEERGYYSFGKISDLPFRYPRPRESGVCG